MHHFAKKRLFAKTICVSKSKKFDEWNFWQGDAFFGDGTHFRGLKRSGVCEVKSYLRKNASLRKLNFKNFFILNTQKSHKGCISYKKNFLKHLRISISSVNMLYDIFNIYIRWKMWNARTGWNWWKFLAKHLKHKIFRRFGTQDGPRCNLIP